jgi:hypothetical protein
MSNPSNPDLASFPVPPPLANFPFGQVGQGGQVYPTTTFMEFIQILWASIQGGGGIIDSVVQLQPNYGLAASVVESLLAERSDPEQSVAAFLGRLVAMEGRLEEVLTADQPRPLTRPSEPIIRLYGDFPGQPPAGAELFAVPMVGDEHFPAGLGSALTGGPGKSFGLIGTAPTLAVTFPLKVNGAPIGTMNVGAGASVATFTMANRYDATAGDLLAFYAPTPQDVTLSSPRYTFVGTRS